MRIHVLGAGIIGLACAAELVTRGHDVTVIDPAPASGASAVAAGMLSPAGEAWHGEPDLHRLALESARLWPSYAANLDVSLRPQATLLVGHDAGDAQEVERQAGVLAGIGQDVDLLDRNALHELAPGLGRVRLGIRLHDRAVDPRAITAALLVRLGDRVRARPPHAAPDITVIATGACLPPPWTELVRGVRGEVVRLRMDEAPTHVIRGWVAGEPVYLVPRADGEVVVGASVEEHDAPPMATAGGVLRLIRSARVLWPAVDRAEVLACEARDRPATRDHLPLIGPTHDPRVWLAAGHYRHGVLLAPWTARMLADALEDSRDDSRDDSRADSRDDSPVSAVGAAIESAIDPAVDPRRLLPPVAATASPPASTPPASTPSTIPGDLPCA